MSRVSSMAEVRAVPSNGLAVASLFAGAGGSSLGYRMAGFDVVYANEFVEEARRTYSANFPKTPLDASDVRDVRGSTIKQLWRGELDVLDGSPPCSGFSELVRKNTRPEDGWGKEKRYSGDKVQRVDDLYNEYCRLVEELRPRAIVSENVESLAEGKARPYLLAVLERLRSAGYRVGARILNAQWLRVPQMRKRLFVVGFREDVAAEPDFPVPDPRQVSVREALEGLSPDSEAERACSFVGYAIEDVWRGLPRGQHRPDKYFGLWRASWDRPANAVTAATGKIGGASLAHPDEPRKFTAAELRRICSFPDDFVLTGTYEQQVERLGRAVPPLMMRAVAAKVAAKLLAASRGP